MNDAGPLSVQQKATLEEAATRLRKLMRAARIGKVNGWTVAIFGVLTVVWGLLSGGRGILVGLALIAVAWNELRGVARLRALDPEGARILGWNQLFLAGVVGVYCLVTIVHSRLAPDPSMQQVVELAGLPSDVVADLTTLVYGGVILGVALVQALLARYHFRVKAKIAAFRHETPPWVVELLAGSARPAA